MSKTTTNPHELREEIVLLRKESESFKTELRWNGHMLIKIQNAQLPEPANVHAFFFISNCFISKAVLGKAKS